MKAKVKDEASILMWMHLEELHSEWEIKLFREFRFHPTRKWRFDFAIRPIGPDCSWIAIEIDGGSWIQGRHNTGSGSEKDREKFNEAARMHYRVLKFTPRQVLKGEAIAFIRKVLES